MLIDEVLTPDSSRFWDAPTYEPGRAQASFDKQFVRDWLETQAWDKTAPGPELPDDVVAGTYARYVEAYERITGASFDALSRGGRHRPMSTHRFAVNVTPKPGILDPQGRAVEGSLGHLGIERGQRRAGRPAGGADHRRSRRGRGTRRGRSPGGELLANPLIEAYAVEIAGASSSLSAATRGSGTMTVRVGVVVFPGSNCDRDTLHALGLAGAEPVALWHEQASLDGVAAVVLPGGFAYGDYLRAGVIARFSPIMRSVTAFAGDGGLVLGHLQRVPGPGRGGSRSGSAAPQPGAAVPRSRRDDRGGAARHAVHPRPGGRGRAVAHADRARRGLLLRR